MTLLWLGAGKPFGIPIASTTIIDGEALGEATSAVDAEAGQFDQRIGTPPKSRRTTAPFKAMDIG
jgi:hypothetical protein